MPPPDRVTVVIATANRRAELCETIQRLLRLPESPPVVVVDNHSADGSPEQVRSKFSAVHVIALPSNEGAAARSVGARAAATPYVAFCDDDSGWDPGSLSTVADRLDADDQLGLVAAKVLVGPTATVDPVSELMAAGTLDERFRPNPVGPRGVTGFLACGAVVRRSAFLAVGGFDPYLGLGGEEELVAVDLAAAGWKLVYEPEAVARHFPSPRRDVNGRRRRLSRNDLLTAGLRYSARVVRRRAMSAVRNGGHCVGAWSGIADAVGSVPWALAHRRAATPELEAVFASGPPQVVSVAP
jgi:N-acetylglucosaminyl-diphospho-decaprenol L-rhamnosyltransferase